MSCAILDKMEGIHRRAVNIVEALEIKSYEERLYQGSPTCRHQKLNFESHPEICICILHLYATLPSIEGLKAAYNRVKN